MGADGPIEAVCSLFWTGGCGVRKFDLSRMNPVVLGGGGCVSVLDRRFDPAAGLRGFYFFTKLF